MTGKEIKELRKSKNLTQQQLADKLGVDRRAVIRWEKEESRPRRIALRQLARLKSSI